MTQFLSELAAEFIFRTIDGLSIRFAESELRNTDALLLSPWPQSVFAYAEYLPKRLPHAELRVVDAGHFT